MVLRMCSRCILGESSVLTGTASLPALQAARAALQHALAWQRRDIGTLTTDVRPKDQRVFARGKRRTVAAARSQCGHDAMRWNSTRPAKGKQRQIGANAEIEAARAATPFEILTTVADFRQWRQRATANGKNVGFVPTMGALHEGHMDLVRQSLIESDLTVVSIFVNPAQFAPTEDLSSYPRTLQEDVQKLAALHSRGKGIAAVFAPTVAEMYPSPDGRPFTQHVDQQVGAFVEVQGLQSQMEGASRPTFFRGVATVCTKLFHIVQPDLAFFGQKDIQQCIILRRLVSDLSFPHPPSAQAVRILPTTRDKNDGLALSSRNAYLTQKSRKHAPVLYQALKKAESVALEMREQQDMPASEAVGAILSAARSHMAQAAQAAKKDNVNMETLYITLNNKVTLDDLEKGKGADGSSVILQDVAPSGAILSGAVMVREGQGGRATRLIDNILLDL